MKINKVNSKRVELVLHESELETLSGALLAVLVEFGPAEFHSKIGASKKTGRRLLKSIHSIWPQVDYMQRM